MKVEAVNTWVNQLIGDEQPAGTDVDIPNDASAERVTAQIGPGPARKVLADLLSWTLMLRAKAEPAQVQGNTVMAARPAPSSQPRSPADDPIPVVAVPEPVASATPSTATGPTVAAEPKNADWGQGSGPNAGRSAADMIQELQQMYQQRRASHEWISLIPSRRLRDIYFVLDYIPSSAQLLFSAARPL